MHYNLLFNGCSFTAGGELEGINKDWEYQRTHRFSHVISQKTGLTYDNISQSGASNDRILRTTVEWFEKGNTCDHAIIQWTLRNRIDYFSSECFFPDKKPRYYPIHPHVDCRQYFNHRGRIIVMSYIDIQNNSNDQNNEDRCMYFMEKLLKDKCSFDYLKLEREPEVVSEYYELSPYHIYRTKFPIPHLRGDILSQNTDTEEYCSNYKGINWLNGCHPNELGHEKIADYIINNFDYFQ